MLPGWTCLVATLAGLLGCAAETGRELPEVALRVEAVVYGGDDRQDYFAHPDPQMRALAASSSVALIDGRLLQRMPDGEVRYPQESFGELYDLCEDERFREQPSLAHCSGTLVGEDLVLTSGHCLDAVPCQSLRLVFGFLYAQEGVLSELTEDDVYACGEVLERQRTDAVGRVVDHAWLRLDRPVAAPRAPAPVYLGDEPLARGEPLTVIGFSAGLPLKIDSGAEVLDARDSTLDFFRTDSDTFHGSSGSGLFDVQGRLRGVLARGADDYIHVRDDCTSVRTDENDIIEQREEATYVARAVAALCEGAGAQEPLCQLRTTGAAAAGAPAGAATCSSAPGREGASHGVLSILAALLMLVALRRRRQRA